MSLHSVVDAHLRDMTEFISIQITEMKKLKQELSSAQQVIDGHVQSGAQTKEQLETEIASLKSDIQASLTDAQTIATNVQGHLADFAADTAKQLTGVIEGGGKRMKRSRRSNRGRKSVRK
jgi:hypothetical protein